MKIGDINGTSPRETYVRSTHYDSMNYHDITKDKFVSKREVNPLNPTYTLRDSEGNLKEIGKIKGSSPR